MQAMVILKRCRAAENEIGRIRLRIRQRRDILTAKSAGPGDPNGGSRGSSDPDKFGRVWSEIDALEREMEERIQRKSVEEASCCALMDMVPELESRVLYAYYVQRMDVPTIAKKLRYTEGYARKIKRRGEEILRLLREEKVAETLPRWYLEEYGTERRS